MKKKTNPRTRTIPKPKRAQREEIVKPINQELVFKNLVESFKNADITTFTKCLRSLFDYEMEPDIYLEELYTMLIEKLKKNDTQFLDELFRKDILKADFIALDRMLEEKYEETKSKLKRQSDVKWWEYLKLDELKSLAVFVYGGYRYYNPRYASNCIPIEKVEKLADLIMEFPNAILSKRIKHIPNKIYTDEMFEHTNNLFFSGKMKVKYAGEETLREFGLSLNKREPYLRQLSTYNRKKIIPSQKRK